MNGYQFYDGYQGGGDTQYLLCLIFFFILGVSGVKNEVAIAAYAIFLVICYIFPIVLGISILLGVLCLGYLYYHAKPAQDKKVEDE
ncbi:hypothetical protein [Vibrio cholerae]|uniref:hypothetical protein n=1 Tax=Vibrio cholerae TaxID=666 RepID=UPI002934E1A8|nr:hypothetical protein [Vibrio cholerae]MDV2400234.1 hypothetical protein [Vibrio cholerae]